MKEEIKRIGGRDLGRFLLEDELIVRYNMAVNELAELRKDYANYRAHRPNKWDGEKYNDDFLMNPRVNVCFFWLGAPYMPKETQMRLAEQLRNGHDLGPTPRQIEYEKQNPAEPVDVQLAAPDETFPGAIPERVDGRLLNKMEQNQSS